ncbi:MAG TPA: hypothetical protein VGM92_15485 [Candidatus Kapabacteria bacterium]|jgi:hypothetical protein
MKLFFCKHLGALRSTDSDSERALQKLTNGEIIELEFRKPRNIRFHRLYWKLCQTVAENMPVTCDAETISDIIKLRTGHTRRYKTKKQLYEVPASISFAAMDDTAFADFFERATKVVCEEILPGIESEELRNEVFQLIGT